MTRWLALSLLSVALAAAAQTEEQVDHVYPEGSRYVGGWSGGQRSGEGVMTYALGGSYRGSWKHDQQEGHGVIIYPNGKRLEGTFHHGLHTGTATAPPKDKPNLVMTAAHGDRATTDRMQVAFGLQVPPNAPYDELTFEQQLIVKQAFDILQDADRPPYPKRGHGALLAILSNAQDYARLDHAVKFDILVDADGKPTGVRVLDTPSPEFARYFAAAAMKVQFTPAVCAGEPCEMAYPVRATLSTTTHAAER
jgi:hypothetical protein